MSIKTQTARLATLTLSLALTAAHPGLLLAQASAQASAPAPARATPQRGTVKSIDGGNLTITTDTGQQESVALLPTARIQRLAPGSTDLKTAETATLADVAVGDRVLISGAPGDTAGSFIAARVILMKSGDIAQKHEAEQQDWQKRGTGGIVTSIDAGSGVLTVASGARKLQIVTTPATSFRRYADGSVRFEDAKPGTLAQIRTGDQMLARGAKSGDGASLAAEEIVSGSFKNLSGTILSVDVPNNSVSLKDLMTQRNITVKLTSNSALHRLPPEQAATLAARASRASTPAPAAGAPAAPTDSPRPPSSSGGTANPGGSAPGVDRPQGMGRSGGRDLSQMVARLPPVTLADLHTGDAVMIVAEQSSPDASTLTAITLLAGVEPILAAAPSGSAAMTLSPWSVGSGAPDGGGSQ